MLPELDYKAVLRRAKFPFFLLPSDELRYEDGLVFLNSLVVDDRNQTGETLGQRRLLTPHELQPLKKCVNDIPGIIDCRHRHFIDNKGFYFTYIKTKFVDVISHKIKLKTSHGSYARIFCSGINFFFVTPVYPLTAEWAQIIYIDKLPWRLYNTSENFVESYKRKL